MEHIEGRWVAQTPFGAIELTVGADGGFDLDGRTGQLEVVGTAIRIAESDVDLPNPQDESWWIPLPDSGGVLRFLRQVSSDRRRLDFASGLVLELPGEWEVGEVPGAISACPPSALRPGLPPSAFIEIYESLAPLGPELLEAAMVNMLSERTGNPNVQPSSRRQVGLHDVHRFSSLATSPTGEQVQVQLWVTTSGDHVLAIAQARTEGATEVTDEEIEGVLRSASFPRWGREPGLVGHWRRTERRPSGPLTEIVERTLDLDEDGTYRRERHSLLEVPEGSRPPTQQPRETRERIGLWYARDDRLLLSAGLQGYRVQSVRRDGDGLVLDEEGWTLA